MPPGPSRRSHSRSRSRSRSRSHSRRRRRCRLARHPSGPCQPPQSAGVLGGESIVGGMWGGQRAGGAFGACSRSCWRLRASDGSSWMGFAGRGRRRAIALAQSGRVRARSRAGHHAGRRQRPTGKRCVVVSSSAWSRCPRRERGGGGGSCGNLEVGWEACRGCVRGLSSIVSRAAQKATNNPAPAGNRPRLLY